MAKFKTSEFDSRIYVTMTGALVAAAIVSLFAIPSVQRRYNLNYGY